MRFVYGAYTKINLKCVFVSTLLPFTFMGASCGRRMYCVLPKIVGERFLGLLRQGAVLPKLNF